MSHQEVRGRPGDAEKPHRSREHLRLSEDVTRRAILPHAGERDASEFRVGRFRERSPEHLGGHHR